MRVPRVKVEYLGSDRGWVARTASIPRNDTYKDTKKEAVDVAKRLAKRYEAMLFVELKNGNIQYKRDYRGETPRKTGEPISDTKPSNGFFSKLFGR